MVCQTKIQTLVIVVRNSNTISSENVTHPQDWTAGKWKWCISNTSKKWKGKTSIWRWLRKSDLKGCREALICSIMEQALRTDYTKSQRRVSNYLFVRCVAPNIKVSHAVSEHNKLPLKECKAREGIMGVVWFWRDIEVSDWYSKTRHCCCWWNEMGNRNPWYCHTCMNKW